MVAFTKKARRVNKLAPHNTTPKTKHKINTYINKIKIKITNKMNWVTFCTFLLVVESL